MKPLHLSHLSLTQVARFVPPTAWFGVSAIFHYLGPSICSASVSVHRRIGCRLVQNCVGGVDFRTGHAAMEDLAAG